MRYELWEDEEDNSLSFFPEDAESFRKLLGARARLIWWCEADSWEEAQARKHEHLGWGPYKPYKPHEPLEPEQRDEADEADEAD